VLKDDAPQFMTQRKDLDNLVKFVLDSLNGEAYEDDAQVGDNTLHWGPAFQACLLLLLLTDRTMGFGHPQVVSVTAHKVYSENPCTQVWIRPLPADVYNLLAKEPDVSTRSPELAKPPKRLRKPKLASKSNSDSASESEEIEGDAANS
jgi:hypothetical protein